MKKLLLFGDTGKLGTAVKKVFSEDYDVIGCNSNHFEAADFMQVRSIVERHQPDLIVNAVAYMGIDPCEENPVSALRLNSLYPAYLAELANEFNYTLIHFASDASFSGEQGEFLNENDKPDPINVYGMSKHLGDKLISEIAKKYYIIRIPVMFGPSGKENQFLEKMLNKLADGEASLRLADDIVSSPSYNIDVAERIKEIIELDHPFGVYHVANLGKASLFELMKEVVKILGLEVELIKGSYKDFPAVGKRSTITPITTIKMKPLRNWQDALKEYCFEYLKSNRNISGE